MAKCLQAQAKYRSSTTFEIKTTVEQESAMIAKLAQYDGVSLPDPMSDLSGALKDTCATRTQNALEAGGIVSPIFDEPSPFPVDTAILAALYSSDISFLWFGSWSRPGFEAFEP